MQAFACLVWRVIYAPYVAVLSPVAVSAVVQCWGYVEMSLAVGVQMPGDIARCMLTVVHHNAGICMSGVVSCLCTIHGCTIAGGCVGSCTVPGVCADITSSAVLALGML